MSTSNKMETAANVATVIVAGLLAAVLVKVYLLPKPAPARLSAPGQAVKALKTGTSLKDKLTGVDWKKNGRTVVLAISTECRFCKASVPFYRRVDEVVGKSTKIVAVLPQPVIGARRYLAREDVRVDQIKQLALSRIGVTGTPTILLVNGAGVVTNMWVGELEPSDQKRVLALLGRVPGNA